ncbi:MAG: N-acetylmuramoyl-L-alanine amidase [Rhodanobacter sp.]
MSLTIHDDPLPYVDALPQRAADAVTRVVIHCTELPDLATAREYGERVQHASGTGNSGHYYIDRDGTIHRYVPATRTANHVRGHNTDSIGIELVNLGRYPDWYDSRRQQMTESYPAVQIRALCQLLVQLQQEFSCLHEIAGHEQLDTGTLAATDAPRQQVRRKLDPGPQFPWSEVLRATALVRHGQG